MGCTVSREGAAFSERDRFGSMRRLAKSSSFTQLRSTKPRDLHYDYHVVALTSSTYGLMKLLESEKVNGHLVSVIGGKGSDASNFRTIRKLEDTPGSEKPPKKWADMAMGVSRFKLEQIRKEQIEAKYPLNPVIPEEKAPESSGAETINTWELMEGLDDRMTPLVSPIRTTAVSTKEIDTELLDNVSDAPTLKTFSRSRSLSAVEGLKLYNNTAIMRPALGAMESSFSASKPPTKERFEYLGDSMDFSLRVRGPLGNAGAPVNFSQGFSGPLSSSGLPAEFAQRYSGPLTSAGLPSGQVMGFPMQDFQTEFPSVSEVSHGDETTDSNLFDPDSNLFDPDILATFQVMAHPEERTSSEDGWCHVRGSDGEASTSGSTGDGDSPVQWACHDQSLFCDSVNICDGSTDTGPLTTYGPRRLSFAKVAPVDTSEIIDPLSQYETKCPPGGEHRVVLYLTSLRGIRKTFEDCHSLRMILQSFTVWIDERDVSMHAEFRQEVTDLLGGPVMVPRLFIKGRYIGGSDEVRRLHEEGNLGPLLQDLPVVQYRQPCDGCGGVRFVPCPECSGSCKIITETNDVAQCPDCNENGLIRCPVCF
ncbi:uncharacterized protein [Physcomitrium patens]|uniref:Glutaredoxin domain-containing protein n=1 Tax=Physcomitrium patens TaxID=3218 RepID=A0A2K1IBT3_PHYPA|nr:uncharacterized protein LOC112277679 [Physcomitrium patens]XP_024366055.1 uncharacterized protein LOC112277679 [Physcomitrium patens]XP_024366056.1 uncharacterized protein LOC112277679 [Physcomitrium patens]XP_024366057.1 uncharacterized protein LOC112277679 [Physcomitrium patens]XP_024366058.1 uncharacterized protein LOC112277679 [Physcomitrium patens]PNR26724.1 hypothetical protein PHYPA_030205 [Physcomitrium patens]|eukprot:XP_024366054.1 uncharacterized protein LOC112277679 [Physcomitrella patens]